MTPPIVKKGTGLTTLELQQMHEMMGFDAPDTVDYIQRLHLSRMDTTVYLFKADETLLAFQMVNWCRIVTPFSKHPLPVLYINLSFKKSDALHSVKDFSRRTNYATLRQELGYFWWAKRFLVTFTTVNPRAVKSTAVDSANQSSKGNDAIKRRRRLLFFQYLKT